MILPYNKVVPCPIVWGDKQQLMSLFLCPNESKKSYTSLSLQGGTVCPGMVARVADLGPASPLTDWKVFQENWI